MPLPLLLQLYLLLQQVRERQLPLLLLPLRPLTRLRPLALGGLTFLWSLLLLRLLLLLWSLAFLRLLTLL